MKKLFTTNGVPAGLVSQAMGRIIMVDYKKELDRVDSYKPEDSSLYWKAEPGQYLVKAMSELEDTDPYEEEGKPDKTRVKLNIILKEKGTWSKPVDWTLAVGKTPASAYGQLCRLAVGKGGSLKDLEFQVIVVNDGTKNTYTIVA